MTETTAKKVYWTGITPRYCDLCGRSILTQFVDGKCGSIWAFMDLTCHKQYGIGYGTGKGQLYMKDVDGRWEKTKG
jgi:hypothetical protein